MWCPEKLKLNKFKQVAIPKNCDFYLRLNGNLIEPPKSAYTGDESFPMGQSKTDILAYADHAEMNQIRREAAEAVESARNGKE